MIYFVLGFITLCIGGAMFTISNHNVYTAVHASEPIRREGDPVDSSKWTGRK